MKIRCKNCGSFNVQVQSWFNPNTLEISSTNNYLDIISETEDCWCVDCNDNVELEIISEIEVLSLKIDQLFEEYVLMNNKEPRYAICSVKYSDNKLIYGNCRIALFSDDEDGVDDRVFYYCDSLTDLKSLISEGVEDFIILDCFKFVD